MVKNCHSNTVVLTLGSVYPNKRSQRAHDVNDVVSTSMRRDDVASTLMRRHSGSKCPLGSGAEFQNSHASTSSVNFMRSDKDIDDTLFDISEILRFSYNYLLLS